MAEGSGDYVRLVYSDNVESEGVGRQVPETTSKGWSFVYWWMKAIFFCLFLVVPAACLFIWGGFLLFNKVIFLVVNPDAVMLELFGNVASSAD